MGLVRSRREKNAGLIETYGVIYLGGHPEYPKRKAGKIEFKVFDDQFEFTPTISTKGWFTGFTIPYKVVLDVQIVQRQVGTVEGLLGGLNSRQLNQPNNIHISYENADGESVLLRLEMLSGVTVMGQARKCQEFEDRLRVHNIREKFLLVPDRVVQEKTSGDIPAQIEKLAALLNKGILSQEEFEAKKTDLLSRI